MAREILAKTICPGNLASIGLDVTMTAANTGDKNRFLATGKEILIARNSAGAAAHTVTVTSAPDHKGRTKDVTAFSMAAGDVSVFGPWQTKLAGWIQPDGYIYLEANHAEILFGVLVIPDDF